MNPRLKFILITIVVVIIVGVGVVLLSGVNTCDIGNPCS